MLPSLLWMAIASMVPAPDTLPAARYFPAELSNPACANSKPEPVSGFRKAWYSKHLRNAGEPSMSARIEGIERTRRSALRFTWLRSFHKPVIVRIEEWGSARPRLLAVEMAGRGGYGGGEAIRRIDRKLSLAEGKALRQLWTRADPFTHQSPPCGRMMDGAQWIIETARPGGYRFIDRQSPDNGPVREVGLALLGLTGWEVGDIY